MENDILLHVEGLNVGFKTRDGYSPAVQDVSFDIPRGKVTAIVGESGSGKSVTSKSILRLLESNAEVTCKAMTFDGVDMMALGDKEMRSVRGNRISMIFQEPMTSLNPLMTVCKQISESLMKHQGLRKYEARKQALELLKQVGIPDAESRLDDYPHQLSGGMRQRVMIAMAIACNPQLLIADEPTTALDVTIQAQILDLLLELKEKRNMSILLITHNLGVVAEVAEQVITMYAGQIVERMSVEKTFTHPQHPYTHGLIRSIPTAAQAHGILNVIEGTVPSPMFYPKGCHFSNRCPYASDKCKSEMPLLTEADSGHLVRCFYPLSDERGQLE